ncbi:MAG TPA: DNA-3-methyladenine glycosylase [Candidatus Saccharimonadales bacterium]|nr:DNA-3-methyladenine glycosylase [Candidatus Saccharimonadales bacterium]
MHTVITSAKAKEAAEYLGRNDPILLPIIQRVGPATFRPHQDYYWELVDSIISQQLSVKAARSIEQRFQELFGSEVPSPQQILQKDVEELRAVGLSRPKANYIRDLAAHIASGKVSFDKFDSLSNDEIMKELIDVKGIGEWTVHMFLMFCMGRLDVLPVGDLGIRNSIRQLYGFKDIPTPDEIRAVAKKYHWAPYESIASWYIWQNLDNTPA